jgi:hypothetical protein
MKSGVARDLQVYGFGAVVIALGRGQLDTGEDGLRVTARVAS